MQVKSAPDSCNKFQGEGHHIARDPQQQKLGAGLMRLVTKSQSAENEEGEKNVKSPVIYQFRLHWDHGTIEISRFRRNSHFWCLD